MTGLEHKLNLHPGELVLLVTPDAADWPVAGALAPISPRAYGALLTRVAVATAWAVSAAITRAKVLVHA